MVKTFPNCHNRGWESYDKACTVDLVAKSDSVLMIALMRRLVSAGEAKALRERAELSISDVARACATSPTTIWRYEKGDRVPHGETAARYANFLAQLSNLKPSVVG